MKKTAVMVWLILAGASCGISHAAQNFAPANQEEKAASPASIASPLTTLTVGEKLVFDVSWMGIPVGSGSLEVKEKVRIGGREAFHVVAIAQTNDFLSHLYPVHDEIHSFIDAQGFYSLEFRKILKEGRYRADERIRYDHAQRKGFYESFRNHGHKVFDIPEKAQDLVSAFYWFRLQPVSVAKPVRTQVTNEEKTWNMEFDVLKEENKYLRGRGEVPTVLVEPKTRLKGVLYDRGRAWVNFTVDARRAPVLITLKTPFGPVVGVLRR